VASIAGRRLKFDFTTIASIAAVVLLVLAVPIVLLRSGSEGNDSVATSARSDDSAVADAPMAEAAAEEVATTELDALADENAAGGESLAAPVAEAEAAPDEAAAEEPVEADRVEEAGDGGLGQLFSRAIRILNLELVADEQTLADEVLAFIDDDSPADLDDVIDDLECVFRWRIENPDVDPGEVLVVGSALIRGVFVNHVAFETELGIRLVVFSAESCEPTFDEIILLIR
jgi:hypothetical protein